MRSSGVAFSIVPARNVTPLSCAFTLRNARTCTFRPKRTSSALSRVRTRESSTSSSSLTSTYTCVMSTPFFALKNETMSSYVSTCSSSSTRCPEKIRENVPGPSGRPRTYTGRWLAFFRSSSFW